MLLFSHQVVSNSLWPHGLRACQASVFLTISRSLPKFMSIQSSRPLIPSSPSVLNLSQSQSLFQWVSSSHQVAKVLELQLQYQSFQWVFRTDFLWDWLGWSICSPRDSQESSPAPQFKIINSLALSLLYSPALMDIYIHTYIHIYVYIWSMNAHSYCYFNNIYCSYTHNVLIYWHFNNIGYRGKG